MRLGTGATIESGEGQKTRDSKNMGKGVDGDVLLRLYDYCDVDPSNDVLENRDR